MTSGVERRLILPKEKKWTKWRKSKNITAVKKI